MAARRGHGEGSIYRRSDGRWVASVDLGWQGGKRKRKVIYGTSRKEVSEKLRDALRKADEGTLRTDERRTVADYLNWWIENSIQKGDSVRPSTAQNYAEKVRLHINPEIGHVRLSKLAPDDIQALLNRKSAQGLSPRTVEYIHAVLRRALGQALKWGHVTRNVATLVDPPRVTRRQVEPLTLEEARALLQAAQPSRLFPLYVLALSTGLRQGEILGLRWQDVDLEEGSVRISQALQWLGGEPRFVEPKSATSKRKLSLPQVAVDALRAHRQNQLEERLALGRSWPQTELVFTSRVGTSIRPRNLLRDFYSLCEKAGIERRPFHHLRHATASFLLKQNVHMRVVMETLGHSQIGLTMNTYSHVLPELQTEAANRMDELLG